MSNWMERIFYVVGDIHTNGVKRLEWQYSKVESDKTEENIWMREEN